MWLPEQNILKELRRILLAADTDIRSTRVEKVKQRYIALCNQSGNILLIGISYPLLAVLNVLDRTKYWHMTYDADISETTSSKTGS